MTGRHLAAVWFADIVGYTRTSSTNERGALDLVRILRESARKSVEDAGGRVVKFLGDGVLAEFSSTDAAVRAALGLRDMFAARALAEAVPATLRIGVHVGEVNEGDDGDIYGDGVNIASRLEAGGQPGRVTVSEDVWRQLRPRSEYRFGALGEKELKGVTARMAAFDVELGGSVDITPRAPIIEIGKPRVRRLVMTTLAVAVTAAVGGYALLRSHDATADRATIAILPFAVRGQNTVLPDLDEAMVDLLSKQLDGASLNVVDPHAVLASHKHRKGERPSPEQARRIASRFGAGLFVLGDVTAVGSRLRISATLYDLVSNGAPMQVSVEGEASNLFALTDELATQLLAKRLGRGPAGRLTQVASSSTTSLAALRAYLNGETALHRGEYDRAFGAFTASVAADSSFVLARYRLAVAGAASGHRGLARSEIQRALAQAQQLSAHDRLLIVGYDAFLREDADAAERAYRAVLTNYGDDAEAWYQLGEVLFHYNVPRGRSTGEALAPFKRALALDKDFPEARRHVLEIVAERGDAESLAQLVAQYYDRPPLEWQAILAVKQGDARAITKLIGQLRKADDPFTVPLPVDYVVRMTRNSDGARPFVLLLTEPARMPDQRSLGYRLLAQIAQANGRGTEARANAARAAALEGNSAI